LTAYNGLRLADGRIHQNIFKIRFRIQSLEKAFPNASYRPQSEPRMGRLPIPSSGGKSRHGVAALAGQRMASTKSRLSVPDRPQSPYLPGRRASIRAHGASVKVRLFKIASVFNLKSKVTPYRDHLNADAA
jgi:hypothetical protein